MKKIQIQYEIYKYRYQPLNGYTSKKKLTDNSNNSPTRRKSDFVHGKSLDGISDNLCRNVRKISKIVR